uniref:Uncharacterized protein n=1 Tax=Candidatus Kentrum sp. DK TaxID=2126562 RepID=A0A450T5V9_9GAMM|nr:MAG: hypothetical protein BECKDK2373C_GA0170839_10952 [Candidatus Kentron sp. DK]
MTQDESLARTIPGSTKRQTEKNVIFSVRQNKILIELAKITSKDRLREERATIYGSSGKCVLGLINWSMQFPFGI